MFYSSPGLSPFGTAFSLHLTSRGASSKAPKEFCGEAITPSCLVQRHLIDPIDGLEDHVRGRSVLSYYVFAIKMAGGRIGQFAHVV